MVHPYNEKKKGISLVEMLITIILFAALATIALKYTKNLFDTGLASKKARIAALMEQATQLSGAYDVFVSQQGNAPVLLTDLNESNISILTRIPPIMTELSKRYWELNTSTGFGSGIGIQLNLDGNTSAHDDNAYCAIFNHEFNKSIEFNVTNENYLPDTAAIAYGKGFRQFCYGDAVTAGSPLHIMIVKP